MKPFSFDQSSISILNPESLKSINISLISNTISLSKDSKILLNFLIKYIFIF